jgi:hypothetical protein
MSDERETLYDLREMVRSLVGGKEIVAKANDWARKQASSWPYGTYSPNDLDTMYEAGYLRGYLAGGAARSSDDPAYTLERIKPELYAGAYKEAQPKDDQANKRQLHQAWANCPDCHWRECSTLGCECCCHKGARNQQDNGGKKS